MKSPEEYARIILEDIHNDMREGIIPRDVGSFSKLHDIFDANMLIIEFMDPDWDAEHPQHEGYTPDEIRAAWLKTTEIIKTGIYRGHNHCGEPDSPVRVLLDVLEDDVQPHTRDDEEYNKLVNTVLGLVDKALAREASPDWCQTCGDYVRDGKCNCWAILAGFLQQYLGMGYDESADKAAKMWRKLNLEDKLRVWHADYADDHFTYDHGVQVPIKTYPRPERNPEDDHRPGL